MMLVRFNDIDKMREKLELFYASRIRVAFISSDFGETTQAVFECVPCDDDMVWDEKKGWWTCSSCSCELTVKEARSLLKRTKVLVKDLRKDVGRKRRQRRWLWRKFLRQRDRTVP